MSQTATAPVSPIATVTGRTSSSPGQFHIAARDATVVSDARDSGGDHIYAGELLLASLASCALATIQARAVESGYSGDGITIEVTSQRGESEPPRYDWFRFTVTIEQASDAAAIDLVAAFRQTCPIYNTVAAASPTEFIVNGVAAGSTAPARPWAEPTIIS